MQWTIRRFEPSDKEAVYVVFQEGITEHVWPAFRQAVLHPDHVALTLIISVTAYVLGGRCWTLALLAGALWVGLVFFCCYEFYTGYVRERLHTDMKDIQASFLADPDCCFWVAEAEVGGKCRILGMVAVVGGKAGGHQQGEGATHNDGPSPGQEQERYGQIFRMTVSSSCRRSGLGTLLAQTAIQFCRDRKFSKIVLTTSSMQTAAIALYLHMGFKHVVPFTYSGVPAWMFHMTKITLLCMEKSL
ncbi:N-acetyltransferase 8-like 2 [Scleropages formosus]|uniref:N-acetyltransferase 8-like 2 n=1 Tax=Scleropages formosus TaxID=113540 RepID=UPI0008781AED|nr:N-acetyltransferase 8-like [Scleropages formosus]